MEQLTLSKTLAVLDDRLTTMKWPSELADAKIDTFITTTALMVKASELAKGIAILTRLQGGHNGGAVLLRSLFEVSIELTYLVGSTDAGRNSSKAIVHGAFELLKFFEGAPPQYAQPEGVAATKNLLNRHRTLHGDVVREVEKDRAKRRFHWSGKSVTRLALEVTGTSVLYQGLSWETHAAMAAVQGFDVRQEGSGALIQFGGSDNSFLGDGKLAEFAQAAVTKTWNDYATFWGLERLARPSSAGVD